MWYLVIYYDMSSLELEKIILKQYPELYIIFIVSVSDLKTTKM